MSTAAGSAVPSALAVLVYSRSCAREADGIRMKAVRSVVYSWCCMFVVYEVVYEALRTNTVCFDRAF